jgi:hypothetical protein
MIKSEKGVSVLVGLALVVITALVALPSPSVGTLPVVKPAPLLRSKAEPNSATLDPIDRQREYAATLRWGRNPFLGPEIVEDKKPDPVIVVDPEAPKLSGISTINDFKMAIIDSQIVCQGDFLKTGHKVLEVTDQNVTLICNNRQMVLTLGEKQ